MELTKFECDMMFAYEPETGLLRWRSSDNKIATSYPKSQRYGRVVLDGYAVSSGKIVWTMHKGAWPDRRLQRKDRDPKNDRIENLVYPVNTASYDLQMSSGRGIYAQVTYDGRTQPLGRFNSKAEVQAVMNLAYRGATAANPGPNWAYIDGPDWKGDVAKALEALPKP